MNNFMTLVAYAMQINIFRNVVSKWLLIISQEIYIAAEFILSSDANNSRETVQKKFFILNRILIEMNLIYENKTIVAIYLVSIRFLPSEIHFYWICCPEVLIFPSVIKFIILKLLRRPNLNQ